MAPRRSPEVEAALAAHIADPRRPEVDQALQPFVDLSALAATLLMALVGALLFVPVWWLGQGALAGDGAAPVVGFGRWLGYTAPIWLFVLFLANRAGVRRQLAPLALVAARLAERLDATGLRATGRLRKGWGAQVALDLPADTPTPAELRVVAARGQRSRPELYLVRGDQEFRFDDPKDPVPELDRAVRAMGLAGAEATQEGPADGEASG